jgi:hypothetical protein
LSVTWAQGLEISRPTNTTASTTASTIRAQMWWGRLRCWIRRRWGTDVGDGVLRIMAEGPMARAHNLAGRWFGKIESRFAQVQEIHSESMAGCPSEWGHSIELARVEWKAINNGCDECNKHNKCNEYDYIHLHDYHSNKYKLLTSCYDQFTVMLQYMIVKPVWFGAIRKQCCIARIQNLLVLLTLPPPPTPEFLPILLAPGRDHPPTQIFIK